MKNINKILGENVRTHRKRLRLTQEELAARCGKSHATIQLMESGKTWPEIDTLVDLAKVFGIDEAELFRADEEPTTKAAPTVPASRLAVLGYLVGELSARDEDELRAAADHLAALGLIDSAADASQPEKFRHVKR